MKAKQQYVSLRDLTNRWACNGAEIARIVRRYEVYLLDIATGDERHPSDFRNFEAFLDVEANGDRILFPLDDIEAVERNHPEEFDSVSGGIKTASDVGKAGAAGRWSPTEVDQEDEEAVKRKMSEWWAKQPQGAWKPMTEAIRHVKKMLPDLCHNPEHMYDTKLKRIAREVNPTPKGNRPGRRAKP